MGQSINVRVAKQFGHTNVKLEPFPTMSSSAPSITRMAQLTDVDASGATDGAVPVFDTGTGKYEVRLLEFEELADGEDLDGGSF